MYFGVLMYFINMHEQTQKIFLQLIEQYILNGQFEYK